MQETEDVMEMVEHIEKTSQEEQKNTENEEINDLLSVHESCESYGTDLGEKSLCVQRDENITCDISSKPFSQKCDIHLNRPHTFEKLFTCSKSFSQRFSLSAHTCIGTNNEIFSCTICMKSFSHKSYLARHNIRNHINEKPFTCTICMKSFSRKSYHTQHIRTHINEKPFSCKICSKSFTQKSNLTKHIRTHSSESSSHVIYAKSLFYTN